MSKASALYVLHEAASGYALFDVVELDEVASLTPELQAAIADADAFKRICKLKAFIAFSSAEQALENINAIAEHSVPDRLKSFLETNLPPVSSKKKKFDMDDYLKKRQTGSDCYGMGVWHALCMRAAVLADDGKKPEDSILRFRDNN